MTNKLKGSQPKSLFKDLYGNIDEHIEELLEEELSGYAKIDGYYEGMTVGNAEQLLSTSYETDTTPFNFRTAGGTADIGNRAYVDEIVGGSLVWNQLAPDSARSISFTTSTTSTQALFQFSGVSTHKYLITWYQDVTLTSNTRNTPILQAGSNVYQYQSTNANLAEGWKSWVVAPTNLTSGTFTFLYWMHTPSDAGNITNISVHDLTLMFGSTIADYLYSLETATTGSAYTWFKKYFPAYYSYDSGTLKHVTGLSSYDTTGVNQFDYSTGTAELLGGNEYQIGGTYTSVSYTDINGDSETLTIDSSGYFTPTNNGTLTVTGGDDSTTFVNFHWSGEYDDEFNDFVKHSYALDDSLTLRGIPQIDSSGNLYYDGDTYASDGTVTRKYVLFTIPENASISEWSTSNYGGHYGGRWAFADDGYDDYRLKILGGLNANGYVLTSQGYNSKYANDSMNIYPSADGSGFSIINDNYTTLEDALEALAGMQIVAKLKESYYSTESADAYTSPMIVCDYGTEEIVSDSEIPVGHTTRYTANLRDKLQHLPSMADEDGTYAVSQSGTTMSLVAIPSAVEELPDAPTTAGTYTLTCTVDSSGDATYSWE